MAASFPQSMREPHADAWSLLLSNPFVGEMASGSLPPEKFRFYIEQNLQYLPEYAKVLGFGAARSTTTAELNRFTRSLNQIVDVELDTNARLRDAIIELGAEDMGGAREPAPACLAYTNFLIATAATGSALDIMVAILPCAWSYHEIAAQYPEPEPHPVYADWLGFFASSDYETYLSGLLAELDDLAGEVADSELPRLRRLFLTAARLERSFWDMSYEMSQWPERPKPTSS